MTTPRRLGPSVDIDALKHIYDVQEQIREARRKAVRKDHQWDYRHSEKVYLIERTTERIQLRAFNIELIL